MLLFSNAMKRVGQLKLLGWRSIHMNMNMNMTINQRISIQSYRCKPCAISAPPPPQFKWHLHDARVRGSIRTRHTSSSSSSTPIDLPISIISNHPPGRSTQQPDDPGLYSGGGEEAAATATGSENQNQNQNEWENKSIDEKRACRVYVGNLSWNVTWQDLKDHMRDAGEVVHAKVITDLDGRSKGFGFVQYSTAAEACIACSILSDTELNGRNIVVHEVEQREEISGDGSGGGGGSSISEGVGGNHDNGHHGSTSVYVGNLAYETTWKDLRDHMRKAGSVVKANILQKNDGTSKGCAIVIYKNASDASRAIRELHDSKVHGRLIFVREDRGPRRGIQQQP